MTRGGEPVPDDVAGRGVLGGGPGGEENRKRGVVCVTSAYRESSLFWFVNEPVLLVCGMGQCSMGVHLL